MSGKSWVTYGAVFVAGALVVGGVWTLTAVTGNQQATTASPMTVTDSTTDTAAGQTANDQPATQAPAEGITPIGSVTRNQRVTLSGTVDRVTDEDEFYLRDNTGTIKVWTGGSFFTVEPGEVVQVAGVVDDDLFIEVYATEIVRESGEVILISGHSSQ